MIAAQGLTKYYGDRHAISDISFEIDSGEIVGILGLNGAGKTTTLKILSCLMLPSAGRVTINDLNIHDDPHEIRKQVGFLPEEPPLYREMVVRDYLRFAAQLRGVPREQADARVDEVLETTSTTDVADEVIADLSHGYRKRVGVGQSLVHRPPVLILDEPISGLDPRQVKDVRELVRSLKGSHTILISSHILSEVAQTCDRVLVIHEGRLVASRPVDELAGQPSVARQLRVLARGERDRLVELVKGIEGVSGCSAEAAEGEELYNLTIETSGDLRELVSRELVQAGFGLLQLGSAEAELESVFIQLTHEGGAR